MQAGPEIRDRFEKRKIAGLEGTACAYVGRVFHIIYLYAPGSIWDMFRPTTSPGASLAQFLATVHALSPAGQRDETKQDDSWRSGGFGQAVKDRLSIHQAGRLNRLPCIRADTPTPIQMKLTPADGHA